MFETKVEIEKTIKMIENIKVEIKDEFSDGINMGLDLAIKHLRNGKNAISIPQA